MSSIIITNYILSRDTAVKGFVNTRVYPIQAPQAATFPYITTNEVSSRQHDLINVPGKYYRDRVTVECLSKTATEAILMGRAVMDCLEGVLNHSFGDYKDISIRFADVGFSDQNDVATAYRDLKQFFVWWRKKD